MGKLSNEDQAIVNKLDNELGRYLETIKRAQQFKLDDFLILKISKYGEPLTLLTNSYGAPIKYRVVYIDAHGIAFVKRINKNGDPVGRLSSCVGLNEDEYYRDSFMGLIKSNVSFVFELDPDFADSIILQDNYDPTSLHKSKKDIWKSVTEHNKACKIPTTEISDVVNFFHTVNIGDTLWTSNTGSYFVQDKKTMAPADFNKNTKYNLMTRIKGPLVIVLTVKDKNGKLKDITPDFFHWKALYRERPRTYKELNI